jgi:hypothetical protein
MNNPFKYTDPSGRVSIVITTYDKYGFFTIGTHSAIYIRTPGESPVLYDPAGSYQTGIGGTRGTGGFFEGDEASLSKYVQYQQIMGSTVELTKLRTTPKQEESMIQRAEEIGDPRGFSCASSVSGVLNDIGGITGSMFPSALNRQAKKAEGVLNSQAKKGKNGN